MTRQCSDASFLKAASRQLLRCAGIAALLWCSSAKADPALSNTAAFEQADAASFYNLDACGDSLDGRTFRRALLEKFLDCPFNAEARTRFARWSQAEQRHSRELMAKVVDANGGLPERLPGMTQTCHEQLSSPAVTQLRSTLQKYAAGEITATAVLPAACDASSIEP